MSPVSMEVLQLCFFFLFVKLILSNLISFYIDFCANGTALIATSAVKMMHIFKLVRFGKTFELFVIINITIGGVGSIGFRAEVVITPAKTVEVGFLGIVKHLRCRNHDWNHHRLASRRHHLISISGYALCGGY
jgi:hypothetical protein